MSKITKTSIDNKINEKDDEMIEKINKNDDISKSAGNNAGIIQNKFISKIVYLSQKIFPIIFSSLTAIFLILLIVSCVISRGKLYEFKYKYDDYNSITTRIEFSSKTFEVRNYYPNGEKDSSVFEYKIKDGKLYYFEEYQDKYLEYGSINSTKLVIDTNTGFKYVFVEKGIVALKSVSITFLIIFAVLDAASIAVLILNKKGIIKIKSEVTDKNKTNEVKKESEEDEKTTKSQEKVEEQKEAKE